MFTFFYFLLKLKDLVTSFLFFTKLECLFGKDNMARTILLNRTYLGSRVSNKWRLLDLYTQDDVFFSVPFSGKNLEKDSDSFVLRSIFSLRLEDFFLLTYSPWPFFASWAAFVMVVGVAGYVNLYSGALFSLIFGVFMISLVFYLWNRDLVRELTYLQNFSIFRIKPNLRRGFLLFILSEAMLFFSLFWAFFHSSVEPAHQLGCVWPPFEGLRIDSLLIPTWNTVILVTSGFILTFVQYSLMAAHTRHIFLGFLGVFYCAIYFTLNQFNEYAYSLVQINDSIFGSVLYVLTLLHGFHVVVGAFFLLVCFVRILYFVNLFPRDQISLTLAAWYWHFVDGIWIFVFFFVYFWGFWVVESDQFFAEINLVLHGLY